MKIIAFPFAGGSAYSFQPITRRLPEDHEMIVLEYPGRGKRVDEVLLHDMEAVIEDVYPAFLSAIRGEAAYLVYGHSMGALTAFLCCRRLVQEGRPLPVRLVVSGMGGPAFGRAHRTVMHDLPQDIFWDEVMRIGGAMNDMREVPELALFFEPVLRADFRAVETYTYAEGPMLPVEIRVVYGTEEGLTQTAIDRWQSESILPVRQYAFPGDHFFILQHVGDMATLLTDACNVVPAQAPSVASSV